MEKEREKRGKRERKEREKREKRERKEREKREIERNREKIMFRVNYYQSSSILKKKN